MLLLTCRYKHKENSNRFRCGLFMFALFNALFSSLLSLTLVAQLRTSHTITTHLLLQAQGKQEQISLWSAYVRLIYCTLQLAAVVAQLRTSENITTHLLLQAQGKQ